MEFNEDHTPLAYLITFRCYGTWLHGDERRSVDRHNRRYGAPLIKPNSTWRSYNQQTLKGNPVHLNIRQRALITAVLKETCEIRKWLLHAANVRSNHVHAVVRATCLPGRVIGALKANATRALRETDQWTRLDSPWADGGSKRHLWTERQLQAAIDYVELGQDDSFESVDDL
jgi:REP element-mobilizing transposase RayT